MGEQGGARGVIELMIEHKTTKMSNICWEIGGKFVWQIIYLQLATERELLTRTASGYHRRTKIEVIYYAGTQKQCKLQKKSHCLHCL